MNKDRQLSERHPSKLFVETTSRCNLRCDMCVRQDGTGGIREGDMSLETFRGLEPAFPHLDTLVLNGIGEPLLHPGLEEFITVAKRLMRDDAWVGFQSNGMLLDEERALSLLEAGLDRICLSVDSISRETFRKIREGGDVAGVERAFHALAGARRITGKKVTTGVEFVLMRENVRELPGVVRWAAERGARFALVTQLLPYRPGGAEEAAYDTNTAGAVEVYETWKREGKAKGIDVLRYFDGFLKYFKTDDEQQIFDYVGRMKEDAASQGIALHVERLLRRDEGWLRMARELLDEAAEIAAGAGMEITLPEMAPRNNRTCEFVESGSTFVSWDGEVHPCYFLWHRYACYVGGWEKRVKPWIFGDLGSAGIGEIWNSPDYTRFRGEVLRYDFPFCFDCGFALCDLAESEDFEQDCYTGQVPCGACLWCTGLFNCLQ